MSTVLTLYFAGSGHGLSHPEHDDAMVTAYKKTNSPSAFLPGPGASDFNVYVSPHYLQLAKRRLKATDKTLGYSVGKNVKSKVAASKNAATGKGWNRTAWYGLNIISDYVGNCAGNLTINLVGHSRGSITVIMLLNDIFYRHVEHDESFSMSKPSKSGSVAFDEDAEEDQTFTNWYRNQLKGIWSKRMDSDEQADQGVKALKRIKHYQYKIAGVNAFLFDPVGGPMQGGTSRKQDFPDHRLIRRVRVVRMETGGMFLSDNMPTFPGWSFLDGRQARNMAVFDDSERLVLPMPGSHGSAMSKNLDELNNPVSGAQYHLGSYYMLSFLTKCGTQFDNGHGASFSGLMGLTNAYSALHAKYKYVLPGDNIQGLGSDGTDSGGKSKRRQIHQHHTAQGYSGGYINAHHKWLAETGQWKASWQKSANPLFNNGGAH